MPPPLPSIKSESDLLGHWIRRWEEKQSGEASRLWDTALDPPDKTILLLHKDLRKAESSALVQFRTGRNGLRMFLKRAKVPVVLENICTCGMGRESARHVLLDCTTEEPRRHGLLEQLDPDLSDNATMPRLIADCQLVPRTARWIVGLQRLKQFRNADALMREI